MNLKDLARALSNWSEINRNLLKLIVLVSVEHHLSRSLANSILQAILKTIAAELKSGRLVRLRNFGTFRARKSHGKLRAKFDDSKNFFRQ